MENTSHFTSLRKKKLLRDRIKFYSILAIGLFVVALYNYGEWKSDKVKDDFVYALAKVSKIESNSDNINFCFYYKYDNKQYNQCISTLNPYHQDSFIIVKISRKDPNLYLNTEIEIPEPILHYPSLDLYWKIDSAGSWINANSLAPSL